MFSNASDVRNHIRSNVAFKTYSDGRLASLYIDNPNDFPVHILLKVFDVILDPRFKREEISFKSFWDVLDHIPESKRQAKAARSSIENATIKSSEDRTYFVPPFQLSTKQYSSANNISNNTER